MTNSIIQIQKLFHSLLPLKEKNQLHIMMLTVGLKIRLSQASDLDTVDSNKPVTYKWVVRPKEKYKF